MNPWLEALQTALRAVPQDVNNATVRRHVNAVLKARQPAKPVMSQHTRLIHMWCVQYEIAFDTKYVFLGKDAKAVARLLAIDYGPKVHDPVEHVFKIATTAWMNKETYPCSMSLTLPKLLSHINEIREWLNANRNGKKAKGGKMPLFKQVELLRDQLAHHVCNPRSIKYDPQALAHRLDYVTLKAKLAALEQEQRKQVLG